MKEEAFDEYSDDSLFNIASWGADMSFRELIEMYAENELVRPEFQRNYVWKKPEASRFIESILLGLPVPSIFLANSSKNQKLIIDGYQRIMTVFDYVKRKKFSTEDSIFRLTNSEKMNPRWRNKSFDELTPEDQRKIRSSSIHAIIFEQRLPKDDDTSMFQIFSRINTSGRPLNAQEIRNCVCQGSFNKLLFELNENEKWRRLYGSRSPDPRMKDIELILRFFAIRELAHHESGKTQINLRRYLDLYMKKCEFSTLDQKRYVFTAMVDFVYDSLGEGAFTTSVNASHGTRPRPKINPIVFEAISVASGDHILQVPNAVAIDLFERKKVLLGDPGFVEASNSRTTDISNIDKRVRRAKFILFSTEA